MMHHTESRSRLCRQQRYDNRSLVQCAPISDLVELLDMGCSFKGEVVLIKKRRARLRIEDYGHIVFKFLAVGVKIRTKDASVERKSKCKICGSHFSVTGGCSPFQLEALFMSF